MLYMAGPEMFVDYYIRISPAVHCCGVLK